MNVKAIVANIVVPILLVSNLGFTFYVWQKQEPPTLKLNDEETIHSIEAYLDQISPDFIVDVQALAKEYDIPSWGCGPTSYALADILNKKFFRGALVTDVTYDGHPYEIVERFRFAQTDKKDGVDHAWLELYFHNKMLFIDPTIGQFGKINSIAYHEFSATDPILSAELKDMYGIIDARLSLLVQKAIDRTPKSQEPYPGIAINPGQMDYYLAAYEDRNIVAHGQMPDSWAKWVSALRNKYL